MAHQRIRSLAAVFAAVALVAGLAAPVAATDRIPTTLTIAASPNPTWVDDLVTITFTVSPIPDGGDVRFGPDLYPVDPVTGTVVLQRTFSLALDPYIIVASYEGTAVFDATPRVEYEMHVHQHLVGSASLDVPAVPVGRGDPFDITVDLDGAPTGGRVLIQDMTNGDPGPTLLSVNVTGAQPMTITMPGLEPGGYNLRAFYEGTAAYSSATSQTVPLTIFDRPTTITLATAPDPSLFGEPIEVTATVHPVPDDGGLVTLYRDGSQIAWVDMDWSTGVGTAILDPMDPGDHTIAADFLPAGSLVTRWAPSSGSTTHTVSDTPVESDPPVGTVLINGGAEFNVDGYVVVSMHASDASRIVQTQMSCDAMSWVNAGTTDGDWGWGNGNSDGGCHMHDGPWTIFVRWRDEWGTWGQASDSIIQDWNAPVGNVVVDGGDGFTTTPTVTLDVAAVDAGSGVSEVALSNDGSTWTEMAYAPTVGWSLDAEGAGASSAGAGMNAITTASASAGTRTVFAKWRDGNGHWSDVTTTTVVLDPAAPTTGVPGVVLVAGRALSSGRITTRLSWSASDVGSGVARFELQQRTDGGPWTSVSTSLTSPSVDRSLAPQHTYAFRVRGVDRAGNIGAWATSPVARLTGYSEKSRSIVYTGTWRRVSSSTYWGGAAAYARSAGAKATLVFTGRSVALVSRIGPSRGKVKVYLDGTRVATIDLYSAGYHAQRVVWTRTFTASGRHRLSFVVSGTNTRPRVDLDGIVVGG